MNATLKKKILTCDLCVIGGGLSGSFAALAAARHGAKVVVMQDRPMLGGNASSEIRMCPRGAVTMTKKSAADSMYDRETGLIGELEERQIYGNPTLVYSIWDATLYSMLRENENITLCLNTSCVDAEMDGEKIVSVTGWQGTTYTWVTVKATLFADCSGDSILATLTGAEYRVGREAKSEFGETLAQDIADNHTMGMSILLAARETDRSVKFTPPTFAKVFNDDNDFASTNINSAGNLGRDHNVGTNGCNLWWNELGGMGDSIHDTEELRDELIANIYGIWDHIKNRGDHGKENWDLEWVGFLPGKRESRRYVGDYLLKEQDLIAGGNFDDVVAYGGWPMDDHNPYGFMKNDENNDTGRNIYLSDIYGIPLRSLYSKNIDNLLFAGRNISATHMAMSSTRVMNTCSLIGQAAGTAAAVAIAREISMREVAKSHVAEVQKMLMDDGVYLPRQLREVSELTKSAKLNLSDEERSLLLNGKERPRKEGEEVGIWQELGESLTFTFNEAKKLGVLRLQFDPDFSRTSITKDFKVRKYATKIHTSGDFEPVKVANTIVKDFVVYADGKAIFMAKDNYFSLVKIPLDLEAKELRIEWIATNGAEKVHLYSADILDA